jgi:hypothetical protein
MISPRIRRLPNRTKTSLPTFGSDRRSLGTYQSTKTSVGSRICAIGVPARESLDAARSHLQLAEEAVQLIATSSAASLNYRIDNK